MNPVAWGGLDLRCSQCKLRYQVYANNEKATKNDNSVKQML